MPRQRSKTSFPRSQQIQLVEYGRERAKATGYEGEEGVDRAIAEYRAEKRAR